MSKKITLAVTLAVSVGLGGVLAPATAAPIPTPTSAVLTQSAMLTPLATSSGKSSAAYKAAAKLTTKGRAPKTGYNRNKFGAAWKDVNRNGCDTRNDILNRDLTNKKWTNGKKCVVASGKLKDPYTGKTINFRRGVGTSNKVHIDHIVPLNDAWQKGAQKWSSAKRTKFANDPLNLVAVDGKANSQKGAGDTATWLPKNKAVRCDYVARQVAVKKKYGVWVTAAEKKAMLGVLVNCKGQKLPNGEKGLNPGKTTTKKTPKKPAPKKADPRFSTCAEAKRHGYGPYKKGSTEYGWYRDADKDGVVCE